MKKTTLFQLSKRYKFDFHFDLHEQTVNPDNVGKIASILINEIDKEIKKNPNTSDGDLFKHLLFS